MHSAKIMFIKYHENLDVLLLNTTDFFPTKTSNVVVEHDPVLWLIVYGLIQAMQSR